MQKIHNKTMTFKVAMTIKLPLSQTLSSNAQTLFNARRTPQALLTNRWWSNTVSNHYCRYKTLPTFNAVPSTSNRHM